MGAGMFHITCQDGITFYATSTGYISCDESFNPKCNAGYWRPVLASEFNFSNPRKEAKWGTMTDIGQMLRQIKKNSTDSFVFWGETPAPS